MASQIFPAIETATGVIETENASCIFITALDPIGSSRQLAALAARLAAFSFWSNKTSAGRMGRPGQ
jgi:hypothetical protein